jgi:2-polyprenyl-3-methyl-5-hydroxy-6-metoxy-1,4-benzoquinol methylase
MNELLKLNEDCGKDDYIAYGREPNQLGWYQWAGLKWCIGKSVLDAGTGTAVGMKVLEQTGARTVYGQDVDVRLKQINSNLIISELTNLAENSFEIVVNVDVIEHIIEDMDFFKSLMRVAKERVIITTPNLRDAWCNNPCHCREYTIPQFANCFQPDELWGGSPCGFKDHVFVLKKEKDKYIDLVNNTTYNVGSVPETAVFVTSPDGREPAHIGGMFIKGS